MHHAGNYDKASLQLPSAYETHSQGYSRVTLVDHSVGSVHMGLGICKLDPGGTLDPHVHFYEEAFYILEGRVLGSIDGRNYQFGPGDYGIIQASVPHAWRGTGDQPARWLEMLDAHQFRILQERQIKLHALHVDARQGNPAPIAS